MFVAEKAYICNMRRWCIKILLIAVLSLVSVFLYEVLWVLVDLDVRRDFINNGIPLDELFFDVRLCTVLTLLSLGYSYLIAKMVKRFVKSIPFRWGIFAFFVLVANTATAAASTAVLDWWLEYVSNDEIRAENFFVFGIVVSFTTSTFVFVTLGRAAFIAESRRRAAEINILKAQIKPHFLMNTIDMLSALARTEPEAAANGLGRMAMIYRYILDSSSQEMATIEDELDFLNNYIDLIDKRAGGSVQLQIGQSVEDSDGWLLPMSLQMLVENALKHNSRSVGNPLRVTIERVGDEIVVSNNLQPLECQPWKSGIGLDNLRTRLSSVTEKRMTVEKTAAMFIVRIPILKPRFTDESIDYRRRATER